MMVRPTDESPELRRDLLNRYDGPIPPHMEPDYEAQRLKRRIDAVLTNLKRGDDFKAAAEKYPQHRERLLRDAGAAYDSAAWNAKQIHDGNY